MSKPKKRWIVLIAAPVVVVAGAAYYFFSGPGPRLLRFQAAEGAGRGFSYDAYAAALKAYVDDQGMVNYRELKANSGQLDAFAAAVGNVDPKVYQGWGEAEKIAFWINAYNALTLEAIIRHYPIRSSFGRSLIYPRNSIRQIPGVWTKLRFMVRGRQMTLDEIEHQVLRKEFAEPRIHTALVCAAMSCPPLRNEPYVGAGLAEQLDDQTRRFLRHPQKFRLDRENRRVYLSSIFKWFGEDFVRSYGTEAKFAGYGETQRALLNFISNYLDEADRKYLAGEKPRVRYLSYDWSLNEQAATAKGES